MSRRSGRRARTETVQHMVRPSLAAEGGRYRPLPEADCAAIDRTTREILTTIGLSEVSPIAGADLIRAGALELPGGRLAIPDPLLDRALADMARPVTLCGQVPALDLLLGAGRSYVGTGGAAPEIMDRATGAYRPAGLSDLFAAACLCQHLPHIQFFSRPLVVRDVEDPAEMDLATAAASLSGTTKHVMVSVGDPAHLAAVLRLCHAIAGEAAGGAAGGAAAFADRPFLSLNINHAVPPLRLHDTALAVLAAGVRGDVPVHCNVFGQVGASSPVTLAGAVAQTMAETLAGIVYAWCLSSAAKAIAGPRPMITDLGTGAMAGGSGEQALATAMAVQMCRWYGLPNSTIAGATDAKAADYQAGQERALTVAMAVQAGCDLVTQAAGMHAGLMGVSLESYVLDNDMLGAVLRSAVPAVVTDETLAVDSIRAAIAGDGHFLGAPETHARMRSDFLYPDLMDRRPIAAWAEAGAPDVRQSAATEVDRLLAKENGHLSADLLRGAGVPEAVIARLKGELA